MAKWFKPLTRKPKYREVLAFDIEGRGGNDGFVCGSIVGESLYNFFTDRDEMFTAMQYYGGKGAWLFALNLEYDLPILAGNDFWKLDLLFTANGLLWADYNGKYGKVKFLEASNLFPRLSVRTLGGMVDLPKIVIPQDLLTRLSTGTPWSNFNPEEQALIERYNARDAEVVYKAVEDLQTLILSLGGQLKPTLAGVAMDIYRRKYHKWPWLAMGENVNNLARPAFYGGRTEAFAVGTIPHCNMYDLTSLYPFSQKETVFPHPNHMKLRLTPPRAGDWLKWEGVAFVTVEIPNSYIPPLPARFGGRLFFPVGEVSALWTIFEIREAIAAGVRLKRVDWVLGSEVTFNPFVRFVDELFDLRQFYIFERDPRANLVKLILNSLYGRFGLNPAQPLYKMVPVLEETDFSDLAGFVTHEVNGSLVAYGPSKSKLYPSYVNVLFASQVTAYARACLNLELRTQDVNAVYCDTDSIITRGTIATADGLGEWREEMKDGTADLLGPKEYMLHNEVFGDKAVAKGVPEALALSYLQNGFARFSRALSVREAMQRHKSPAEWVEVCKSKQEVLPKRYPVGEYGANSFLYSLTLPYRFEDLPGLGWSPWSGKVDPVSQNPGLASPLSMQSPFPVDIEDY